MTSLFIYRSNEFLSAQQAESDGALYEVKLVASPDAGITSMFFRDFIDDIPAIVTTAGKVIDASAELTVVMKHPETNEFISTHEFIEWSYSHNS